MSDEINIEDDLVLLKSEKLILRRRRHRKLGELVRYRYKTVTPVQSMESAAKDFGVTLRKYTHWEQSLVDLPEIPDVEIGNLTPLERCFIYKLRSNITTEQIAKKLKMNPYAVKMMELGHSEFDRLLDFWEC